MSAPTLLTHLKGKFSYLTLEIAVNLLFFIQEIKALSVESPLILQTIN